MDEGRPTLYATRRVARPVAATAQLVEAGLVDQLSDWRAVEPAGPTAWPFTHRTLTGVLPVGRGRRARVELDIEPWSEETTELGLRPVGRVGLWSHRRREAYAAAASRLLDRLTATARGEVVQLADERRPAVRLRRAS